MTSPKEIRRHLDSLLKPPGSLGKLETLASRLCRIQGTLQPRSTPRRLVVFAGDHGVVEEKVSAWQPSVTTSVIRAILAGRSAGCVLAHAVGAEVHLVDVGSLAPELPEQAGYFCRKVRVGTRNLVQEPALTVDEFEQALAIGRVHAEQAGRDGVAVAVGGEVAVGNTISAACLAMLLGELSLEQVVGRGAEGEGPMMERRTGVVARAVETARKETSPTAAMASVAGLEIAALAGFYLGAALSGLTVVLDGLVSAVAALIAERRSPGVAARMIASHAAAEPGHALLLAKLGLEPFLGDWSMRLGEGTGALLLLPLLDAAAALVRDTGTLEQWGVARVEG